MVDDRPLRLSEREIADAFSVGAWAEKYPPVLTPEQAAELLQVSLQTFYQWRSRGLLAGCSRKVGKRVRVFRDRLMKQVFNEGLPQ